MTDNTDHPNVIALPPLIFIIFLLLGVIIQTIYPVHILPPHITTPLAINLLVWSVLIGAGGFYALRKAKTNVNVRKPTTSIVTTGVFNFTRNPLYLSLVLLMLTLGALANSLWIIVLTVPFIVVLTKGVIEREEEYLEHKFRDEYTSYKSRVRRWI